MAAARTASLLFLLPLLGFSTSWGARERLLEMSPERLAPTGGALRLRLSPPASEDPRSVWIGLTFGRTVRVPTIPDPSEPQRRFCADIPALDRAFPVAPREGDHILLVVYAGTRPLAGPRALPVARETGRSIPCGLHPSKGDVS